MTIMVKEMTSFLFYRFLQVSIFLLIYTLNFRNRFYSCRKWACLTLQPWEKELPKTRENKNVFFQIKFPIRLIYQAGMIENHSKKMKNMNISKVTKARWPQRQVRWSSRGWVSQAHRAPAKDGPLWCQGNITNTHDDTRKQHRMTQKQKTRFNTDLYEGLLLLLFRCIVSRSRGLPFNNL